MKKISILLVAFVTLSLSSCSSDDNDNEDITASIVGKWEYSQTGEVINGVEVLETYEHTSGCNKDYIEFKSGGNFDDVWYSNGASDCVRYNDPGTWSQNGMSITTTYSDQEASTGEILILNETTLKVRFVDSSEGTTETYITILTKQ